MEYTLYISMPTPIQFIPNDIVLSFLVQATCKVFKPNIFGSRSLGFAKTEPRRSTWNWFKSNSSMFAASNAPSQSVGLAFITTSRGIESDSLEGAAEICVMSFAVSADFRRQLSEYDCGRSCSRKGEVPSPCERSF